MTDIALTPLQFINIALTVTTVVLAVVAMRCALRHTGGSRVRTHLLFFAVLSLALAQVISATAGATQLHHTWPEHLFEIRATLAGLRMSATIMLLYYIFSSRGARPLHIS